ncbi:hypothetical protein CF326_g4232 [Tilletia indica]|nr:hypothetical protein CF326_g4232 [Tilletia indica]
MTSSSSHIPPSTSPISSERRAGPHLHHQYHRRVTSHLQEGLRSRWFHHQRRARHKQVHVTSFLAADLRPQHLLPLRNCRLGPIYTVVPIYTVDITVRSQVISKQAFAAADSVTNEGLGRSKFISGVVRPQYASKQHRNIIDSPSQCSTLIIFNLSLASKVVLRRRPAVPFSFSSTLPMSDPHHLQSFSS